MKKGMGIFLMILGSLVSLIGIFLFVLEMKLLLENVGGSGFGAMLILLLFTLLIIFLGVLPLVKGIKKVKTTAKAVQTDISPIAKAEKAHKIEAVYEADKEEESTRVIYEEQNEESTTRIICRDEQFDNGEWSMIKLLLKSVVAVVVPIFLTVCISIFIVESADGHPNTVQAWGGLVIVVMGSTGAMLLFSRVAKYNAVGNRYFYYVLDSEKGLYYTHIGAGRMANYIRAHVPAGERIKNRFSILYMLLFLVYRSPGASLTRLSGMDSCFKINQKYHFAEKVLSKGNLDNYCTKIVAVEKIKYFSKGCQVWFVTLEYGIKRVKKQYIYRNTNHYATLMKKMNELYTGNETEAYELSLSEMKQVRKNIYRRLGVFCFCFLVYLLIAVGSYFQYISTSEKSVLYEQITIANFYRILASRSRRRVYYSAYLFLFLGCADLVKMIIDLLKTSGFRCVPAEVTEYIAPQPSFKNLFYDYNYFATVLYHGEPVRVGMSKAMWKQGKKDKVTLVLKKNIPYCVVERNAPES